MIVEGIVQCFGRWSEGLIDAKSRQSEQNGKDADGDRKGW